MAASPIAARSLVLSERTTARANVEHDGTRPGLSTVVPEGGYTGTVAWLAADVFLRGLRLGLQAHPERLRISSHDVVALETFMRVITLLAASAEPGTGRDVRGRKKEIAKAAGCSPATVQRVGRHASRLVRCLVLVVRGRRLTLAERLHVWRCQTSPRLKQHGVPPVRAFHVPAWLRPFMAMAAGPVDNRTPADLHVRDSAHHSRKGRVSSRSHLGNQSPSAQAKRKGGSLRSPSGTGSARTARMKARASPATRRLAVAVRERFWWASTESLRRLEPPLQRFAEAHLAWTAEDLENVFQADRVRRGLSPFWRSDAGRTPYAFLASLLRPLNEHDDHPRLADVEQAELRCGRPECVDGWIEPAGRVDVMLALTGQPGALPPAVRCDRCRPGAWPSRGDLDELNEPPF